MQKREPTFSESCAARVQTCRQLYDLGKRRRQRNDSEEGDEQHVGVECCVDRSFRLKTPHYIDLTTIVSLPERRMDRPLVRHVQGLAQDHAHELRVSLRLHGPPC